MAYKLPYYYHEKNVLSHARIMRIVHSQLLLFR